jgi:hypothetical protein
MMPFDCRGPQTDLAASDANRGVPQDSPLSPLLSNLYMRRFVLAWQRMGY